MKIIINWFIDRPALCWGLAFFLLSLAVYGGHIYTGDGEAYLIVAARFLLGQKPVLPAFLRGFAAPGLDGLLYSKFGLGLSLAIMPLLFLTFLLGGLIPGTVVGGTVLRAVALLIGPLVGGASVVLFYRLSRRLRLSKTTAAVSTLFLVGGGLWLTYTKFLLPELVLGAALLLFVWGLVKNSSGWLVGLAAGFAVLLRVEVLLFVIPPLVVYLWRNREQVLQLAVSFVGCGLLIGFYNWARFGQFWNFGMGSSEVEQFSTPLLTGLFGQFFVPGNGLFLYAPYLALSVVLFGYYSWAESRRPGWLELSLYAGGILFVFLHSKWHSWMGGWSWGPRRIVPLLPLVHLSVGWCWARTNQFFKYLLVGLLFCGLCLNLGGLLVDYTDYYRGTFYQQDVLYTIEHSQLYRQNLGLWTGLYDLDIFWFRLLPVAVAWLLEVFLLVPAVFLVYCGLNPE